MLDAVGTALDALLSAPLFGPWAYTGGRAALLLVGLLVLWRARRHVWMWTGLGLWALLVGLRVLADTLTGGAERPWSVYAFATNTATVLIFIGLGQLLAQLWRLRRIEQQAAVYRAERDAARAMVDTGRQQYGLSPVVWPPDAPGGT